MNPGDLEQMVEKIISEIRFIETDDGFRIEMKGDKARLKKMGWGPGMIGSRRRRGGRGYGRKQFWHDMWRDDEAGTHRHSAHKHGDHRHDYGPGPGMSRGPWPCWGWVEDEAEEPGNQEKPPKNV